MYQTANELAKEYADLLSILVNQYCQLRDNNPFDEFIEYKKLIEKYTCLYNFWLEKAKEAQESQWWDL